MVNNNNELLEFVTWAQVRARVHEVNPELAAIIDDIDPPSHLRFVKARYGYGQLVVDQGITQLPIAPGLTRPFADVTVPAEITRALSYSAIPLMLTLHNANEVFIETPLKTVPLNLFHAGSLLGLFETMDALSGRKTPAIWCVSAGARTVLMLPKISEASGLRRLRAAFNLPTTTRLKFFTDHWSVFRDIALHKDFPQAWHNEILFFTESWFTQMQNSKKWNVFKHYIFMQAWGQAHFRISDTILRANWEVFATAISQRHLKPSPYHTDHIKHLLAIVAGKAPSLRPINNTQVVFPSAGLQQIFIDSYGLKAYAPTLFVSTSQSAIQDGQAVYSSLAFPTLLEGTTVKHNSSTVMADIKEIKLLLDTLRYYADHKLEMLDDILREVSFEFFHTDADTLGDIQSSEELNMDVHLMTAGGEYSARPLCTASIFWRGCIRIKRQVLISE